MSLTQLPLELWQNVALQVVFAVLSEVPSGGPVLPASLLDPPLDADNYGNAGSARDPVLPWHALWRGDAPVTKCTCRGPLGMFSGQTQYCYKSHPPSSKSHILALLAINHNLRSGLIGLRELWSQIPLMFPQLLPDSLIWAGCDENYPLRLVGDGLCGCVLAMLLREPRFLEFASELSAAFHYDPSRHADHPAELLFKASRAPNLHYLDLRFDATYAFDIKNFDYWELPSLRVYRGLNNPTLVHSATLTELYLAVERPELAVPANVIVDFLRKCPLLEILTLQMVLCPSHNPFTNSISLPKLRFILVCDCLPNWQFLWSRMVVSNEASVHVDIICSDYGAFGVRILLVIDGLDMWPGFARCQTVILDYHEVEPAVHGDVGAWPEYVCLTVSDEEDAAWAGRDPAQRESRCSLTFRFCGDALETRYPSLSFYRPPGTAPNMESLFGMMLRRFQYSFIDFKNTRIFVEKAGGRARHLARHRDVARFFPNLRILVIFGVMNPNSSTALDLVFELASAWIRPRWGLRRVELPDWDGAEDVWQIWNNLIAERNPGGNRIVWSR